MSEATIQIAYDGPALASGIMDVRELAPTLLGFADLYEHANKILNGDDAYVYVNVQSDFKRGSFEISFQVLQNLAAQASVLAGPDGLISANELVTVIAYGVFRLIKFLKGKKPIAVTPLPNGNIQITIENHQHIETSPKALELYNDNIVQRSAKKVMKPLESIGVDKFEIKQNNQVIESIAKAEANEFLKAPEVTIGESEILQENELILPLEILRVWFKGTNKWRLTDGTNKYDVVIEDEHFLKKVETGAISFKTGDTLRARLLLRTRRTKEGLKTEYVLLEVIEFVHPHEQIVLIESK